MVAMTERAVARAAPSCGHAVRDDGLQSSGLGCKEYARRLRKEAHKFRLQHAMHVPVLDARRAAAARSRSD